MTDIIEKALQPRIIETNGEDQNICAFCYAVIEDENAEHEPDCMQPKALEEYKGMRERHLRAMENLRLKLAIAQNHTRRLQPMQPKFRTAPIVINEKSYMVAGQISLADGIRRARSEKVFQEVPVILVVESEEN